MHSTNLMVDWVECEVSKTRQTTLIQPDTTQIYLIMWFAFTCTLSAIGTNKIHDVIVQYGSDRCSPSLNCASSDAFIATVTSDFLRVNIAPPPPCKYDTPTYLIRRCYERKQYEIVFVSLIYDATEILFWPVICKLNFKRRISINNALHWGHVASFKTNQVKR